MAIDPEKVARFSVGPVAADRRTGPRYKFAAAAEVIDDISGGRIEARVTEIGRRGCYLDTSTPFPLNTPVSLRITNGTEMFEAKAKVVSCTFGKGMGLLLTTVDQRQDYVLATWMAASFETPWLASDRRKSRRIKVRLPVRACGKNELGSPFEEETYTQTISAHGALILLAASVRKGQVLTLSNSPEKNTVECVVAHVGEPHGGLSEVGVVFVLPNQYQLFWNAKTTSPSGNRPNAKSA